MKYFTRQVILTLTVFVFFLFVCLFKLADIPGEWYGDISNVHEYVSQILAGDRPFYFFQSPGPLYHYLVVPVVLLYQNHGYETYKLASIVVSLIGLIGIYLFAHEIAGKKLALITTLLASFSFWYLVWSRLGNSQIVIPALVSFMSLFTARYVKEKRFPDLLLGATVASLGWYAYPQTFILPLVFLLFILLYLFWGKEIRLQRKSLVMTVGLMIVIFIPFMTIIRSDLGNFGARGYVGGKVLPGLSMPFDKLVGRVISNYEKTLLMLHVAGDKTFRVNIPGFPQLDTLSGIFFFLGFLYFWKKKRRIWLFFLLFMLLVLPLPSVSPVIPEVEIPSSGRTIAVGPFVFLLVSAGIFWLYGLLLKRFPKDKDFLLTLVSIIFGYIVFSNLKLYFVDYSRGLPDANFASGKIIANYIDILPKEVAVYFGSCCWGEWGHPEPKAVAYVLRKPRNFIEYSHYLSSCQEVTRLPAIVIFGPKDDKKIEGHKECFGDLKPIDYKDKSGNLIFRYLLLEPANNPRL